MPSASLPAVLGGVALGAVFGAVALVRRDRPLHAFGASRAGTLEVRVPAGVGVPLLDEPGRHEVLVRVSRAASLTHRGPDVMGLAVRVPGVADDGGHADLLLASTGLGRLTRYVLALRTRPDAGAMTTLLPSATATGSLVLAARPDGADCWVLAWSRPGQAGWSPCAVLELGERVADPGHFDPVGRPPAGMPPPVWVRRLRGPAYRWSRAVLRRGRGDSLGRRA